MIKKLVYFLTILIFQTILLRGQPSLKFEHVGSEYGQAIKHGYSIAQHHGIIFIGSTDGLKRFDGYDLSEVNPSPASTYSFGYIYSIVPDGDSLLLLSSKGLGYYSPSKNTYNPLPSLYKNTARLGREKIIKTTVDVHKNIWCITKENGVFCFEKLSKKLYHYYSPGYVSKSLAINHLGEAFLLTNNAIMKFDYQQKKFKTLPLSLNASKEINEYTSLAFDRANNLWLGTVANGVYQFGYTPSGFLNGHQIEETKNEKINCLLADSKNNIWIGKAFSGLTLYNINTNKISHAQHSEFDSYSLQDNYVNNLFEDEQGSIWVGQNSFGFSVYNQYRFPFSILSKDASANPNGRFSLVSSLYEQDHTVYIGSQLDGLGCYNTKTNKTVNYKNTLKQQNQNDASVFCIKTTDHKNLWLGTGRGLGLFNIQSQSFTFFPFNPSHEGDAIFDIQIFEKFGEIWAVGEFGLRFFDMNQKKWKAKSNNLLKPLDPKLTLNNIFKDSHGSIWLAGINTGIIKIQKGKQYLIDNKGFINCNEVTHFYETKNKVWVATPCGLFSISNNDNYTKIEKKWVIDEKPSLSLFFIAEDKAGNLWLTTDQGVYRFSPEGNSKTLKFTKQDQILSADFFPKTGYIAPNGILYVGGKRGVNYINTGFKSPADSLTKPKMLQLVTNNKAYEVKANTLKLDQNEHSFDIYYSSFDYKDVKNCTYLTKLEGIDEHWIKKTGINHSSYSYLPSGKYKFELLAQSRYSNKTSRAELIIEIPPKYYETLWFKILAGCFVLLVSALILFNYLTTIKLKIRLQKEEALLKAQASEAQMLEAELSMKVTELKLLAVKSQINPHFIFNFLNLINYHSLKGSTAFVSELITKFSKYLRISLEENYNEFITLEKELTITHLFLELEKKRFKEKLHFKIQNLATTTLDTIKVPPLLLQPFVESAIWYGLMPNKEGGSLEINIYNETNHLLYIKILDSGIGRKQSIIETQNNDKKLHLGFDTTLKRLKYFYEKYHQKIELTIHDRIENGNISGTEVVFKIYL